MNITNDRQYQLDNLKQIHHEIILLALLGYKQVEIAEKLEVTPVMVNYTLNSPIAQKKLEVMRMERDIRALDIPEELKETAPVALAEMQRMLIHPNTGETNRRQIAEYILDSCGYGPRSREEETKDGLTTEEIRTIKDLARKQGYLAEVEEAEAEVVEAGPG